VTRGDGPGARLDGDRLAARKEEVGLARDHRGFTDGDPGPAEMSISEQPRKSQPDWSSWRSMAGRAFFSGVIDPHRMAWIYVLLT
jgi:hypothetical protein